MASSKRPASSATPAERVAMPKPFFSDLYHFFLTTSWPRMFAIVVSVYLASNALFGCLYLLGGDCIDHAQPGSFGDAFFFSVQTMATIGYGSMFPKTLYAHILVTLEALTGLLGVAMATGLVFAKFARPSARVMWSQNAIIAVRDGVPSLMFRMANERATQIVEAQLRLVLVRDEFTQEGEQVRRFHELKLSRDRTAVFALSWTAIHPIAPDSPLHGMTRESLRAANGSLVVSLVGIDETFSQTVHARHMYPGDTILWGAKFVDIMVRGPDGRVRVDYARFHDVVVEEEQAAVVVGLPRLESRGSEEAG